jgi:hypothetical protein
VHGCRWKRAIRWSTHEWFDTSAPGDVLKINALKFGMIRLKVFVVTDFPIANWARRIIEYGKPTRNICCAWGEHTWYEIRTKGWKASPQHRMAQLKQWLNVNSVKSAWNSFGNQSRRTTKLPHSRDRTSTEVWIWSHSHKSQRLVGHSTHKTRTAQHREYLYLVVPQGIIYYI